MRQIFDINQTLQLGDYAVFTCDVNDNHYKILAFCYDDEHWGFYCESTNLFFGSGHPRLDDVISSYPFLQIFSASWELPIGWTLSRGLSDVPEGYQYRIVSDPVDLYEWANISVRLITEESEEQTEISEYICDNYKRDTMYRGFHGYHHHRSVEMNAPKRAYRGHRIGIELEVEFNTQSERQDFCDKPSNWLYRESDGSLGSYGCEIITIPLLPDDAKSIDFWKVLTDSISGHAKSWDTGRCGLHVHMGREILGRTEEQQSETIGKLLYLYHHHVKDTRVNQKIYGRERGYNDTDGKTDIGNAAKIFGGEVFKLKDTSKKVKDAMIERSNRDRYFDINLRNTHTIEFRKGKGSINPNRIAMVVDYCERMCIYARNTPWQQIGYNDFFAFMKATCTNQDLLSIINDWA